MGLIDDARRAKSEQDAQSAAAADRQRVADQRRQRAETTVSRCAAEFAREMQAHHAKPVKMSKFPRPRGWVVTLIAPRPDDLPLRIAVFPDGTWHKGYWAKEHTLVRHRPYEVFTSHTVPNRDLERLSDDEINAAFAHALARVLP